MTVMNEADKGGAPLEGTIIYAIIARLFL